MDIENKINLFKKLKVFSLVATPRSGSDYFQSLLDWHPQIMSFNGSIGTYVNFYPEIDFNNQSKKNILHSVKKFLKLYKNLINSKNDKEEGKNQLGKNKKGYININLKKYRTAMLKFIKKEGFNKKNFTLAVYFAYNFCLNLNFKTKKILLLHPHNFDEVKLFASDFPESKYIFTIRDQRAGYFSMIYNLSRFQPNLWFNLRHHFITLYLCLLHSDYGEELKLQYYCVRLEDLPHKNTIKKVAKLLKINFNKCLLKSTFAGQAWWGDNKQIKEYQDKWKEERTYNHWKEKLKKKDQLILNCLLLPTLKRYEYELPELKFIDYVKSFFYIFSPMDFEIKVIKSNIISILKKKKSSKELINNIYYFLRRVLLCQKYFFLNFIIKNKAKIIIKK